MKKSLAVVISLLLALGLGVAWFIWGGDHVLSLDQPELQSALETGFPIEKTYLLVVRVRLSEPVVTLRDSSDRIAVAVRIMVGVPGLPGHSTGTAELSCLVRYDASQGSFFADDPIVERLSIDGHSEGLIEKTTGAVTWILKGVLDHHPVYTLKTAEFGESMAKLVLKDARVRKGRLRLTLRVGD